MLPEAKAKGDQLAECLTAAKKHGLAVHVWRVNWRLNWRAQKEYRKKLEDAGRLQRDTKGETLPWLCPSSEENRNLERDAMLEIVRNYAVDGVHFDYIRYPGQDGCYCGRCRATFEKRIGAKVARWPWDVRDGGPHHQAYLQFRRENITAVVAAVAEGARKIRPGVKVSAAVFWNWTTARGHVGQDWKLWVEKGYLDFACPMQYTPDSVVFADMTAKTRKWTAGKCPLMPGIGATLGQRPEVTLRQVQLARQAGADGFVLFNYQTHLAGKYLPLLRLGATRSK